MIATSILAAFAFVAQIEISQAGASFMTVNQASLDDSGNLYLSGRIAWANGFWISEGHGASWTPVVLPADSPVLVTLLPDPEDPNILFAIPEDRKSLLKSTDAGRNFRVIRSGEFGSLTIDPGSRNILLATARTQASPGRPWAALLATSFNSTVQESGGRLV